MCYILSLLSKTTANAVQLNMIFCHWECHYYINQNQQSASGWTCTSMTLVCHHRNRVLWDINSHSYSQILALYGTCMLIAKFTRVCQYLLSWVRGVQYITPNTLRPILIFLYLNVPGGILPFFLVIFIYVLKFCLHFLSLIQTTCRTHSISHIDHMPCPFPLSYRPHTLPIPSLIQTTCPAHSISHTNHPPHLSFRLHALPIPSLIQTTYPAHSISHTDHPYHLSCRLHALPIPSLTQTTYPAHSISHTDHMPCPFPLSYRPPVPSLMQTSCLPIPSLIQTTCLAHSISHTCHIPCPFHLIQTPWPAHFNSYRKMPCPPHSALFYIHNSNYFWRVMKLVSMQLSESSFFFFYLWSKCSLHCPFEHISKNFFCF